MDPIGGQVEKSFFCLELDHPIRRFAFRMTESVWFERASLIAILGNCYALSTADPCDSKCQQSHCQIMIWVELVIFVFFFLEMLIKMTAIGVWGKGAYLSDGWNRLDMIVVVAGTAEYCFATTEAINLSVFRMLRVLRPLRAINRIASKLL